MLVKKLRKNFEENKGTYIKVGVLVGVGFMLGRNYQRKLDMISLTKALKSGKALVPILSEKVAPSMSLAEVKTELLSIAGSVVKDAIVVNVNGTHAVIVG